MGLVRTLDPAAEPATLREVKAHLRVDHDDEDPTIEGMIKAAREQLELITRRQFVTATWTLTQARFENPIRLSFPPLQSITSVKYIDGSGNQQTVASSVYEPVTDDLDPRVRLQFDQSWPTDVRDQPDAVEVIFLAGYGGPSAQPERAKAAIKLLVAHWYENREAACGPLQAAPQSFVTLSEGLRTW